MSGKRRLLVCLCATCFGILLACGGTRKSSGPLPRVEGEIADVWVEEDQFVFTVKLANRGDEAAVAYPVVYGVGDKRQPFRRDVWGFRITADDRESGLLADDIAKRWGHEQEVDLRARVSLAAGASESIEGALILGEGVRDGRPFAPGMTYTRLALWVFTEDGRLAFQREYDGAELDQIRKR